MNKEEFNEATRLSRRRFLGLMGGGMGIGLPSLAAAIERPTPWTRIRASVWPMFRIAKPQNHLCVDVELVNLKILAGNAAAGQPQVHIASHGDSGYIVLRFPAQHFAEQAVWDRGPQVPEKKGGRVSSTYKLWREYSEWENMMRNDDLAFLSHGPWKTPGNAQAESEARKAAALAGKGPPPPAALKNSGLAFGVKEYHLELERQRRARKWHPQWDVWLQNAGTVSDESLPHAGFRWNHGEWTKGLAGIWASGPSQLVFEVPQWLAPFPCDPDRILELCTRLDMRVSPQLDPTLAESGVALPADLPSLAPGVHPGGPPPVTAIEFPTLLYLSPYQTGRWKLRPSVAGAPEELWSMELEAPVAGPPLPGTPRQKQEVGHLFAFARRKVEEARWPQDGRRLKEQQDSKKPPREPGKMDDAKTTGDEAAGEVVPKYSAAEAPKTSLYEATRELLVKQMGEDNGDITAKHLSLTGLGASAELRYQPWFEPVRETPVEELGELKEGDSPAEDPAAEKKLEGFLTEWIQKTDRGRDYYTKEAFAGYWMPWGFRAESVTVTERMPCVDPFLEPLHGGVRERRRDLLQEAEHEAVPPDYEDIAGQEANLIALLVGRKFARVKPRFPKAGLVREFGSAETEDFFAEVAEGARNAGLRKVELLVDRTPVLANVPCQESAANYVNLIKLGRDLSYAGGTGRNAATEIFLPRVREFAINADGKLVSMLTPYRFPMRFTYQDGRTELVEMPMLFVPSREMGKLLYKHLPESLRAANVGAKIAVVRPPSPGAVNARDMGPAVELEGERRDPNAPAQETGGNQHLQALLSGDLAKLVAGHTLGRSGSKELVANGINAFIDGPRNTIQRLLGEGGALKGVEEAMGKLLADFPDALAAGWQHDLEKRLAGMVSGTPDWEAQAREIVRSLRQHVAWGVEEITEVDHLFAATRLEEYLLLKPDSLMLMKVRVDLMAGGIRKIEEVAKRGTAAEAVEAAEILKAMKTVLGKLEDAAKELAGAAEGAAAKVAAAEKAYRNALLAFLFQWAAQLNGRWRRHLWDPVFHQIFRASAATKTAGSEGGLSQEARLLAAAFRKRLQLCLFADMKREIVVKIPGSEITLELGTQIRLSDELATIPATMENWLGKLKESLKDDAEVLARLLEGVEQVLPDERGLRLRLHRLVEDRANRGAAAIQGELDLLFGDLRVHLSSALAHGRDGKAVFERFVERAERLPEFAAQAKREVLGEFQKLENSLRGKLEELPLLAKGDTFSEIVLEGGDVGKAIGRMEKDLAKHPLVPAVRGLFMDNNSAKAKQMLDDIVNLTGGRIQKVLEDRLADLVEVAAPAMEALETTSGNAEAAMERLESLFTLAESLSGEFRSTLEGILRNASKVPAEFGTAGTDWVARMTRIRNGEWVSWRTGRMAVRLAEDILRIGKDLPREVEAQIAKLRKDLLDEIDTNCAVPMEIMWQAADRLAAAAAGPAGKVLEARAKAIINDVTQSLNAAARVARNEVVLIPELPGYVMVALLDLGRQPERKYHELLTKLLEKLLGDFASATLDGAITKKLAELEPALKEIRRQIGDLEPRKISDAIKTMTEDGKEALMKQWLQVHNTSATVAEALKKDLASRVKVAEGDVMILTRRALASLPSASFLSSFEDQTKKAIFQGSQLLFSLTEIGKDISFPKLDRFRVEVPGLPGVQDVHFAEDYLKGGLRELETAAKGAVFGVLADATKTAAAQAAGMVQVGERIQELSREYGAVAANVKQQFEKAREDARKYVDDLKKKPEEFINGLKKAISEDAAELEKRANALKDGVERDLVELKEQFAAKAEDLLPPGVPKLMGSIPLDKVLGVVRDPASLPKAIMNELPDRIERTRRWSKTTETVDLGIIRFEPQGKACKLEIDARAVIYLPGPGRSAAPPSYSVRGKLGAFDLMVMDMLLIHFQSLLFIAENGSFKCEPKLGKAKEEGEVAASGGGGIDSIVEFQGALKFVEDMRKTLSAFLSGKSPFRLELRDSYIFAGLVFQIPALGFGAVSITGLSFRTSLGLPLSGGPLIYRFALCDRIETFKVAVSGFAGGGFFALEMSTDPNLSKVEGAIEFGGVISLNLGVAVGEVSIMAGMYFSRSRSATALESYFRVSGVITVFGFVDVYLLIMLALSYRREGKKSLLFGTVTVRIRVKIGFFSKSFSFDYHKKIAGSGGGSDGENSQDQSGAWLREPRSGRGLAGGLMLISTRETTARFPYILPSKVNGIDLTDEKDNTPGGRRREAREWPSAKCWNKRPQFAPAPRFSETMSPSDWDLYWKRYHPGEAADASKSDSVKPTPGKPKPGAPSKKPNR